MQVEGDTQLQQGINWTALLGSLGSVKLTVHVDRVVFAGVGTVVVCLGRGIVAQHQHQGSNKEEISAGHFDTLQFMAEFQTVKITVSNCLKSTNSRNWDISNSLDDSALYTGKGPWHRQPLVGIAVRGDEVHPPPEA